MAWGLGVLRHDVRRFVALLLLATSTSVFALDPERAVGDFYHSGWTVKEGAPGQVSALAQTRDGYLWLATQIGLFRFDGVAFERFAPPEPDGFPSDSVSALFAPASGGLWVGFRYGGASFVDGDRVESFVESDGFSTGSVFGFAEARDGTMWVATYQGLMRRRQSGWEWVRGEEWGLASRQARAVLVDSDDTTWVATGDTIHALAPGSDRFRIAATGIAPASQLAEAPDGAIWIAEADGVVRRLPRDADGVQKPPVVIPIAAVSLLFDRDGTLWVGTTGAGVHRYPYPDRLVAAPAPETPDQSIYESSGLTADYVGPALEDREGNVWFGTARGLDRIRAARFVPAGLPAGSFDFAIVPGSDGSIWVGTRNRPLLEVTTQSVTTTGFAEAISCAMRDRERRVWLGGPRGIWRLEGDEPRLVTRLPSRAPNSAVQAMAVAGDGALWVSLNVPGIARFDGTTWTHVDQGPGLVARASPLTLASDDAGRVWAGYSRNRITRIATDGMRLLGAGDGLDVGNVTVLASGTLGVWVGGERGVALAEGDAFHALRSGDDLAFDGITGLIERDNGDLWLNGSRGVVHVAAAEVLRALENGSHRVSVERFDYLDGLPGAPAQFRPLPTAVAGSDGRLWFASTSGVTWLDPSHIARNPLPPPVSIRAVVLGDRVVAPTPGLEVPARTSSVRIQYTAPSLAIPERVRFRYRLDGLDESWRDAGTRREASFDRLPPGDYRFQVIAANDDGVWNDGGATLAFAVAPTFVQTWWFKALATIGVLGLVWAFYLARVHQLAERIRLRAHERHLERERIARELHDTLLQGVQGLVLRFQAAADSAADPRTRATLENALDRADAVLAEGRDRVKNLRAAAESSDDLSHALDELGRELAQAHASAFRLEQVGEPHVLEQLVSDEVYRVAREALANAFRHAQANNIVVELAFGTRELRLRVSDDGRGIGPEVLAAGGRPGHWGIVGMEERARRVGGAFAVRPRSGAGTEVELTVPADIAYPRTRQSSRWRALWRRLRGPG